MKLYHALGASAILAIALTACTADDALLNGNGDGTVTFTLRAPGHMGSRAGGVADFGDGTTANKLEYYVYDLDNETPDMAPIARGNQDIPLQTTVTLNLVNGKNYGIVWFAQNESKPYVYDTTAHTITIDYMKDGNAWLNHNLEDRDAFYAYTTIHVTGADNRTVQLYRPFAQVNFGTSDLVSEEEDKVNFDILVNAFGDKELSGLQTKLETVDVPNVLNLMTGKVEGKETLEFLPTERPSAEEQAFPYKPETYKHLAMNYILAPQDGDILDLDFTVLNAGKEYNKLTIASAPVRANYRTNIFGQLLTSTHKFDVEIVPMFNQDYNPDQNIGISVWSSGNKAELAQMIAEGGEVVVASKTDIVDLHAVTTPVNVTLRQEVEKVYIGDSDVPVTLTVAKGVPYPEVTRKPLAYGETSVLKNFTYQGEYTPGEKTRSGEEYASAQILLYSWGATLENVTIRNIKLDGSLPTKNNNQCGIVMDRYVVKNLLVENCEFVNMKAAAINTNSGLNDDPNFSTPHGNITVRGCVVNFAPDAASSASGLYILQTNNIVVENNIINNAPYHGIFIRAFNSAYVKGNIVRSPGKEGIKVETDWQQGGYVNIYPLQGNCKSVKILDNILSEETPGGLTSCGRYGIRVGSYFGKYADEITVTGNKVYSKDYQTLFEVKGNEAASPVLTVKDNVALSPADVNLGELLLQTVGFTPAAGSDYDKPFSNY